MTASPTGAAADHQRYLAAPDVGFCHGVHADRERPVSAPAQRQGRSGTSSSKGLAEQHALGILDQHHARAGFGQALVDDNLAIRFGNWPARTRSSR
jgi:hypothetical protein